MGALVIFPIAAALAVLGRRKFEETVFPAVGIVTVTIMLAGMLGSLKVGVFVVPLYLAASVVFLIVRRMDFRRYVLTPGLPAFVVFIVFFLVFSFGRFFVTDAALSKYGLVALNMFDTGSLKDSCAYYELNWPIPFVSVWAYFCCFTGGGFSEWMCIFSYDIFIISAVLPIFTRIKSLKEESWQWMMLLLFCILLPILKLPGAYSAYDMAVPQAVSMVYAYLMLNQVISFRLRDGSKWWYAGFIAYGLFLSCILTQYGVYASIPLMMVMCSAAVSDAEKRKYLLTSLVGGCLLSLVFSIYGILSAGMDADMILYIPVCCLVSVVLSMVLTLLVRLYEKGYKKISLIIVLFIVAGIVAIAVFILQNSVNSDFLMDWFMEYTDKIFVGRKEEADYIIGRHVIPVYDVPFLFFMMVIFGFASGRIEKKSLDKTAEIHAFNLSLVFGSVLYMLILCILYINVIRQPHSAAKPSIAVYVAPVVILSAVAVFKQCLRAWRKDIVIWAGTVALTACVFSDPVSAVFDKPEYENEYPLISACEDAGVLELTGTDRVFYIDRELTDELPISFVWEVFPAGANSINGLYFNPEPYKWDDDIREPLTPEKLADVIEDGKYTYVYLKNVDDYFWETYYPDFANFGADIRNEAIYRVEYDEDGQLQIEYIAGIMQEDEPEEAE